MKAMRPRIAIPVPHSGDPAYAARALPQYERAIEMAGGEPVRIPLDQTSADVIKVADTCDAVLLPGSRADVDPAKFGAPRDPKTADADFKRDTVDALLLQEAYKSRKPVLGICYGLQILNVYRKGSLVQHIESSINHEAGRKVAIAHTVEVVPTSRLAEVIRESGVDLGKMPVNSSHHQSADDVGEGLRVVARCGEDGVVEGLEGTEPDHFVLAVQWHPERSVDEDAPSRAIFSALVAAAQAGHRERDASEASRAGAVP
jgi:putative glutamine amidotransferase